MYKIENDSNGLTRVVVEGDHASGQLYLQGAHCTAWRPAGHEPVLWMSDKSNFALGKPIRGGVPICFPWFGPHSTKADAPAHGTARTTVWNLDGVSQSPEGDWCVTCSTKIEPFTLEYVVQFGQTLTLTLTTSLPATHAGSAQFEDALHTYLKVSRIEQVSIRGLESVPYIDKVGTVTARPATGQPITFSAETDRVYAPSEHTCILRDPDLSREILIRKSGSHSTVVWNPWIAKSARMPDFGDDEWTGMVCIETANVGAQAITLQPGASHRTVAIIEVRQSAQ